MLNHHVRTTVTDADEEGNSMVNVRHYKADMNSLAEDVGERIATSITQNPTGCRYFNPVVTVSCPSPTPAFFRIVRKEQARWCRQASATFPRHARRLASTWIAGGEWISHKYARYLNRAACFTGILFVNGRIVPAHEWPGNESPR